MVSQADTGISFAAESPETPETNVTNTESKIQVDGKNPLTEAITSVEFADVESPTEPTPEIEMGEVVGTGTLVVQEEEPALDADDSAEGGDAGGRKGLGSGPKGPLGPHGAL